MEVQRVIDKHRELLNELPIQNELLKKQCTMVKEQISAARTKLKSIESKNSK